PSVIPSSEHPEYSGCLRRSPQCICKVAEGANVHLGACSHALAMSFWCQDQVSHEGSAVLSVEKCMRWIHYGLAAVAFRLASRDRRIDQM
ncbi:MAG: hypothetical protein VX223_09350, partial [Myxococcota bacterium]|nr:hypothetical protein [Myxococcota bacterium]